MDMVDLPCVRDEQKLTRALSQSDRINYRLPSLRLSWTQSTSTIPSSYVASPNAGSSTSEFKLLRNAQPTLSTFVTETDKKSQTCKASTVRIAWSQKRSKLTIFTLRFRRRRRRVDPQNQPKTHFARFRSQINLFRLFSEQPRITIVPVRVYCTWRSGSGLALGFG